MKKVINIGIGGRSFIIDEDAYARLGSYLDNFRNHLTRSGADGMTFSQTKEVMDEIELRISELLSAGLGSNNQVVTLSMVEKVIAQLGMPDGKAEEGTSSARFTGDAGTNGKPVHKFYREEEGKAIAGVCTGIAAYFNIDVVLVRIIFLITATSGLWIYLIIWLVAPVATTAAQRCELRGIPATAENMATFSIKK